MSATRILVLGVVSKLGKAHGYQVRRELLSWRADIWAEVAPASIYQALRTLAKRGMVEPVVTEAAGGPDRTVFRLTPDGETEFLHLVRSAVSEPGWGADRDAALNAAFSFLPLLRREEVCTLLGYRERALRGQLVAIGTAADPVIPPQVGALVELYEARLRATIDWTVSLAERIRDGAFVFADDGGDED